jgi:N4-gp56 family major capsid protein
MAGLDVSNLTSTVQAPVNFVYMRGLLSAARKRLPYFNGSLPGQLEKKGGSMSVKWRRIENLTATTTAISELTENGPVAFGAGRVSVKPTITDITVATAKYGNFIILSEEVDLFNISPITMTLMDTLGANAGESLNTLQANVMKAGTNVEYAGAVANKSAVAREIQAFDIKRCTSKLQAQSAQKFDSDAYGSPNVGSSPVRASFFGIVHTDVEEDIRGLTGFVGVEQYGGYTQVYPYEFGAANGVRWVSTEIAPVETGTSTTSASNDFRGASANFADVYWSFIYGKEAIGTIGLGEQHAQEIYKMYDPARPPTVELITQPIGSSGVGDPFKEYGSIAWKAWYAGKILNTNWMVSLVSLSKAQKK